MTYLIDSDWLIDALNGAPHAIAMLDRLSSDGLAISVVTLGEVYEGTFQFPDADQRIESARRFLGLTEDVMETFARVR